MKLKTCYRNHFQKTGILIFCLLALSVQPSLSYATDAIDIINKSELRTKSKTEKITYQMDLIDKNGNVKKTRTLETFYKNDDGREATLQKFLSPPIIQGTGLLIIDTGKAENNIWFYLPSTRRLRRVSGAEKSNWYMGTEFTYEDFEDYQTNSYKFTLLGNKPCNNDSHCYVIEATPATEKEKSASGYSKKIYWIEELSLYPVQVQYFTNNDHMSKILTATNLTRRGNYWRPGTLYMSNLDNKKATRITEIKRDIDVPLKDYYVSKRFLRKD